MKLVLASKSPRRREILSMVTSNFDIRVSGADEKIDADIDLYDVPKILAERKAEATPIYENEVIIGCDTVVILGDEIMGKPTDKNDAIRMLRSLSGTVHYVVSGIAIKTNEKLYSTSVTTAVKMRKLIDSEILSYVERFNPVDKAGAYGIQEMAGAFVEKIDGDFYNVVGLPLCELVVILRDEFGINLN
ncbi:MAG: septum formation protein Maf [Clostridia bacterium]|nr:septum formation protein Maf [Clostridia bacterium]